MFVLAALLSLSPQPVAMMARPFCPGVESPAPVVADRLAAFSAPVVGCASHVRVECSPEVVARPVRPFLATGDALALLVLPGAQGGEASCVIHSDQGAATVRIWIPE